MMTPPYFAGKFGLTLDGKGRIILPASIRKDLDTETYGSMFFVELVQVGTTMYRALWLRPEKYFYHLMKQDPVLNPPVAIVDDYYRLKYGEVGRATFDVQGRMQLPQEQLDEMKLTKRVTLVGMHDRLEIWSEADYTNYRIYLKTKAADIVEQARKHLDSLKTIQPTTGL